MDPTLTVIVSGLLSLAAGAFSGFFVARGQFLKEIAGDVRLARKQAYKQLWELSGKLPRFPSTAELGITNLGELYDLSVSMANWYFNSDGGIIMSKRTQSRYMKTQACIEDLLLELQQALPVPIANDTPGEGNSKKVSSKDSELILREIIADIPLSRQHYLMVQKRFSTLRNAMTKDLLSRRRLFFNY